MKHPKHLPTVLFSQKEIKQVKHDMLCDLSALKNQKSLLFTQISSTVDPQEQASLRKLLAPIKVKIRNFHSAEKHRKKRWLF